MERRRKEKERTPWQGKVIAASLIWIIVWGSAGDSEGEAALFVMAMLLLGMLPAAVIIGYEIYKMKKEEAAEKGKESV